MSPGSVAAVVAFLLIVAPGVAYELARLRRRPPRQESAFVEASRVLLGGVLIATVTLVIMAAGRAAQSDVVAPAKQLLANANRYAATHPGHVLLSVVAYLVLAVTIAAVAAEAPGPGSRELEIVPDGAWFLVLSRLAPKGTYAQVAVTTTDGRGYVGKKLYFGSEIRHDDRELVLEQPIDIIQPGQTEPVRLPSSWHRLILPGSQITSMAISFVKKEAPPDGAEANAAGDRSVVETHTNRLAARLVRTPRWRVLAWALVIEVAALLVA